MRNRNEQLPEEAFASYAELARTLTLSGETKLPLSRDAHTASLPPLTPALLQALIAQSERLLLAQPRYAWTLLAVAAAVAKGKPALAPSLQAQLAYQQARAANAWSRPSLAAAAADRAYTLFAQLDQPGWVAACHWQRYALPWMQPRLADCIAALQQASQMLHGAGPAFATLLAECRLTLAYAQVLAGEFTPAAALLEQCQRDFEVQDDALGLARSRYVRAGCLRRQSRFDEARAEIEAALAVFRQQSPVHTAQATCQLGFHQLLGDADYDAAADSFQTAANACRRLDLQPWLAVCQNGLAQMYIMTGRLAEADEALTAALTQFNAFKVLGQQAATLLDRGWLEVQRGNYAGSLEALAQAEQICRTTGNRWLHAASHMHLGETHLHLGQFQRALYHLEAAWEQFAALNSPARMAECDVRLANAWLQLGRAEQAHHYLDHAWQNAERSGQDNLLPTISYRRAHTYFQQRRPADAQAALQEALALAQQQQDGPGEALARRLLGEALATGGQYEQARQQLEQAEAAFARMEMVMEQAACHAALGEHYLAQGAAAAAEGAWQQALHLSQGLMPEVAWRALVGRADLAERRGDQTAALEAYDGALQALGQLRSSLWQAGLANTFLQRSMHTVDRAVSLAARVDEAYKVLQLTEAGKAQIIARHLHNRQWYGDTWTSPEVQSLRGDIRWLQAQLQAAMRQRGESRRQRVRELLHRLASKRQAYETAIERMERRKASQAPLPDSFSLAHFRHLAARSLRQPWIALSYYCTPEERICTVITPTTFDVWRTPVGPALVALRALQHPPPPGQDFDEEDLQRVAASLLPTDVQAQLTPQTTLIIAPHRELHNIPWAALRLASGKPLVAACTPVVVPSLRASALLWQRKAADHAQVAGLLLAVSTFSDASPPLPAAGDEADALAPYLGANGALWRDGEVTWERLREAAAGRGLARYTFLHVASHAFHDGASGRLSGIVLHDQAIYLDELWQCAPLPCLVTLSACSGSRSLVLAGDEHVGLTTTCLAAGAQQVVGSLWPVLDDSAPRLMTDFYAALHDALHDAPRGGLPQNSNAAAALAHAQRKAWQRGEPAAHWGAFRCTGQA